MKSHRVMVKETVSNDQREEIAVAYGTKFLLNVVDVDVFQQAYAETWKGQYNVVLIVQLTDEQVEAVKAANGIAHLEEV